MDEVLGRGPKGLWAGGRSKAIHGWAGRVSRDHPPHLDLLAFLLGAASFLDSGLDEVAWSLPDALVLLSVVEIEFPL